MGWTAAIPRSALDLTVAAVGLAIAEVATWVDPNPVGTPVHGPLWLRIVFPLALALPLAWRREAPLAAFAVVIGAVVVQGAVTDDSPEGLEMIFCVGAAMYAAATYATRTRAVAALALGAAAYAVYASTNVDIRSGESSQLWAGAFFAIALVTVWLVGLFVRYRRGEEAAEAHARALEESARQAVSDERARLARELHDVVSHNLSVVVVQAAGARAAGDVDPSTLEKIERSGRESLIEMRRLLGVLRRDGDAPDLEPQPGLAQLDELASSVSAAGVPVRLMLTGRHDGLPPAVELSVFRIVQEALTNVLKHAGAASATVRVAVSDDSVTIDVEDDGPGPVDHDTGGHGLVGMRERVALFGGSLRAEPLTAGGFGVHAVLPHRSPGTA
jgi:signal transduction histidine kinase